MSSEAALTIHIDGAARGNPGPAAYAYVITGGGHPLIEEAGCLGSATNNVAEYTALVKALERARALGGTRLHINSDSELLVKQMNGEYRVKNEQLRDLFEEAKLLARHFDLVAIRHVPRAQNGHADRLCNEVLDGEAKESGTPAARKARPKSAKRPARDEMIRQEAVRCLQDAARAWSRGDPAAPTPDQVWDQLWSILDENGIG
jgi:ribonuclease HI